MEIPENKWKHALFNGTEYGFEEANAVLKVINEWAPTNNINVKEFEKEFAEFAGGGYGVSANSWVGAAQLLAIMLEFKSGDEVIVPALTFQASSNIFIREGAKIVFADSDPRTFNIDPIKLESLITNRTRAIVVVHMCGQSCDMDAINKIAGKYNIPVIQDAAHAVGALYKGKPLAQLSDYVLYSFHQSKNMSTLGEGGMLVTADESMALDMKKIRTHGSGLFAGISSRMTDMQGAVGLIQLKRVVVQNEKRREVAHYMSERLSQIPGITPPYEIPEVVHTYHLYNILIEPEIIGISRDELLKKLWTKKKIMTGKQYSPTVNCLEAYKEIGYGKGLCPVAEDMSERLLSLPISFKFTNADVDELVDGIVDVINAG